MLLTWIALAFLAGLALGDILVLAPGVWLAVGGLSLAVWLVLRRLPLQRRLVSIRPVAEWAGRASAGLPRPLSIPLLVLLVCLGAAYYQFSLPRLTADFLATYNDRVEALLVDGVVSRPPELRDGAATLEIGVLEIQLPGEQNPRNVHGNLIVYLRQAGDWRYGDRLQLRGRLETPSEEELFSLRDALAVRKIYSVLYNPRVTLVQRDQGNPLWSILFAFRSRALATVYRLFPDPEASLLAGILLGVDSGMTRKIYQSFKDTGTAHIIVISGFNITIIARLFYALFRRLLGKRRGAVLAAAGIGAYTVLVGAEPAVVRAAILGGIGLLGQQVGRRQDGLNSLAFAALVMILWNPFLLHSASFQLSFTATLGLVLYAQPLTEGFTRLAARRLPPTTVQRLAAPVGDYLLATLAATLASLPVMVYISQHVSPLSLLVNTLILPVQPAVMVLSGIATLLGMAWLPLGQALAYVAWPFSAYTIRTVEAFALLPGASLAVTRIPVLGVAVYYAVLLSWRAIPRWLQSLRAAMETRLHGQRLPPGRPVVALSVLGALAVLVWRTVYSLPDDRLHLTVLDVSRGDALLVQTPTGRYVLIDGGDSPTRLADGLGRRLPVGRRSLDYLVVAASGAEQVDSLPYALERFPAASVLWAGPAGGSGAARRLQEYLVEAGIPIETAQAGQSLDLGGGAALRVLAAGPRGAVLLLEWGSFRALLPVGIDMEMLGNLLADPSLKGVDALLLSEGGLAAVNPPEWIAHLHPEVILLSVAAGNRDGLPSPETLQAVQGYSLLRTDRNGWIHISTDGEQLWVEVERK